MPLPDPIADGMPAAPVTEIPRRRSPDDVMRDYVTRCPPATEGEIFEALDGWDAGAYLSHWTRRNDNDNDSADLGPAGRQ